MRNTTINPQTSEMEVGSIFDAEHPDETADPEGVEQRAATESIKMQLLPSYHEKDFEFRRGYKDQNIKDLLANGKRAYFLQPRASAVALAIADADGAARAAMEYAVDPKSTEVRTTGEAIAAEAKDLDYALGGLDQWLDSLTIRAIARQASSDAVFIARGDAVLSSWNPKDDNATERKDSFENTLFSAQKRLATLLWCLKAADSLKHLNVKSAAWQRMQSESRKLQAKYMHADEYNVHKELNGELSTEAARVSRSGLIKRAA